MMEKNSVGKVWGNWMQENYVF